MLLLQQLSNLQIIHILKKDYLQSILRLSTEFVLPQQIVITTHQGPDGDAMGSSLALYHFLKKMGQCPVVITPNDYPEFLHWLPGNDTVVNFMRQKSQAEALICGAKYIFCMDFNHLKRTADMMRLLYQSKATLVLIDHHPEPDLPAEFLFSDPKASSTCELLYRLMKQWNDRLIDRDVATCLYTGLMTDTGNFCYGSTNAQSFVMASELMGYEIDRLRIYAKVYSDYSEDRMRLMGYCLNEKMEVLPAYRTALIGLNLEEQERYRFAVGDSEGFVNLPLSISGMRFSAFFLEKEDKVKMSFRSTGNFSVNDFARKHFGGGGHLNAAGGDSKRPIAELLQQFRDLLPQYKLLLNEEGRD
jgi:phosphoesterase RecJ-like protein